MTHRNDRFNSADLIMLGIIGGIILFFCVIASLTPMHIGV